MRNDMVDEMRSGLDHAPGAAERAEPALLAGSRADTGVVEQRINAAGFPDCRMQRLAHGFAIAHVERDRRSLAAQLTDVPAVSCAFAKSMSAHITAAPPW